MRGMKRLLKFFTVFLFLYLFQNLACAENIGITLISDVHLVADKKENKMTPSIKKLIDAVEMANADTSKYVVFLGDNTGGGNKYDIAMFSKVIKKLNKPYFVLAGNRDINRGKNVDKKEFYRIVNKFSSNKVKKLPSYKKEGEYVFVFMGGLNETFPTYNGYYKDDELLFLDKTLTKFKDKKVIIFQHFPVVPPKEDENRATYKKEEYTKILKRHDNVLAIVSGHYHHENIIEEGNIKHISVGALIQGEYEQIKIFKNKNGSYTITTKILNLE